MGTQKIGGSRGRGSRPVRAEVFTVVHGGQEWGATAGVMRSVPQRLVDLKTGKEAGPPAADQRQQEGAKLRGKDGKMYQVKNGVPVSV